MLQPQQEDSSRAMEIRGQLQALMVEMSAGNKGIKDSLEDVEENIRRHLGEKADYRKQCGGDPGKARCAQIIELSSRIAPERTKSKLETINENECQFAQKEVPYNRAEAEKYVYKTTSHEKGLSNPMQASDSDQEKGISRPIVGTLSEKNLLQLETDQPDASNEAPASQAETRSVTDFSEYSELAASDVTSQQTVSDEWAQKSLATYFLDFVFKVKNPEILGMWDIFIFLLTLWATIAVPYTVSFNIPSYSNTPVGVMDCIIEVSFFLDLLIGFRTAFRDQDGGMVHEPCSIAAHYLQGWFCIDLICVLPLDHLRKNNWGTLFHILKAFKAIKVAKRSKLLKTSDLIRILRLPEIFYYIEDFTSTAWFRGLRVFLGMIIVSHWSGCLFHFTAWIDDDHLQHDENHTWLDATELNGTRRIHRYIASIYWAIATLTSVGYGDIVPTGNLERYVAILCMTFSVTIFAYLMGAVSSIFGTVCTSDAYVASMKQNIDDMLRDRQVPRALAKHIRQFGAYIVGRKFGIEDSEILSTLPSNLRTELVLFLYQETLKKIPFFDNKSPQFIADLVIVMKIEFYAPGDYVVIQGERSSEMFFVTEGTLSVRLYENRPNLSQEIYSGYSTNGAHKHLGYIQSGSQFGEYSCLISGRRKATVVAEAFSEAYSLTRTDLLKVMRDWPKYSKEMIEKVLKQSRVSKGRTSIKRTVKEALIGHESIEAFNKSVFGGKRRKLEVSNE